MTDPDAVPVQVHDLTKRYGAVEALRGVSFAVAPGEIFGLLGPNGAGKTTTLECLLGLRAADSGRVILAGFDLGRQPAQAKARVGAQLQSAALQDKITPREALRFFGTFYPAAAPAEELLARFSLADKADASFDSLSGGQKQRLFLALAFIHRPSVVVLDEPTAGLDPQARRELHQIIAGFRAEGRTVLLSTHDLLEAEQLCDRIGLLHAGRIVAVARPAELLAHAAAPARLVFRTAPPLAPAAVAALEGAISPASRDASWVVNTRNLSATITSLMRRLEADHVPLLDLQVHRPSLEDVFIELTGQAWFDQTVAPAP